MTVPFWIWAVTFAVILGLFIFDFYSHVRTPHEPTIKESAWWSVIYVLLALARPSYRTRLRVSRPGPRKALVTPRRCTGGA